MRSADEHWFGYRGQAPDYAVLDILKDATA